MKKLLLAALLPAQALACTLTWEYGDHTWIEGYRVYQNSVQVGTAAPADRSGSCTTLGLIAGPGPVTMTAYRGADESAQSEPASFDVLTPTGLSISITVP